MPNKISGDNIEATYGKKYCAMCGKAFLATGPFDDVCEPCSTKPLIKRAIYGLVIQPTIH